MNMIDTNCSYYLLGEDRVKKDFRYVFRDILSFVDESDGSGVHPAILCGFDKEEQRESLSIAGKKYGTDYFYEQDFFSLLDEYVVPNDRDIVIWGTGNMAGKLLSEDKDLAFSFFIDSKKEKDEYCGKPVCRPDDIMDYRDYYVIVAVVNDGEIRDYLDGKGLLYGRDYLGFDDYLKRASMLLKKTIFDKSYWELDCETMLNHFEVLQEGETACCCTTFVNERMGSILDRSVSDVWNSYKHRIMCLSTENRTFSFCDKSMCPLFVGKKPKQIQEVKENRLYRVMSSKPETLVLSYDDTCNLYCESCRNEIYVAKGCYRERIDKINRIIKEELLSDISFIVMAGAGEVFSSLSYRDVYTDEKFHPNYIRLLTNGTLFDNKHWEALTNGINARVMLTVSVDAATSETYKKLRRGGDFGRLKSNMEFASELRKSGELSYFRMNFVVQRKNYKEMPLFVEWCEELGCDEVFFTKILNWGTYTDAEFRCISMMEEDEITPQKELLEIMNDPRMKSPIVDMGTIQALHAKDQTDYIKNYYMWELEKRGGRLFEI